MRVSATFARRIMSRSSWETRNDSSPAETLVNAPERDRWIPPRVLRVALMQLNTVGR